MERKIIITRTWQSPCGNLVLGVCDGRLCVCDWGRDTVIRRLSRYLDASAAEGDDSLITEAVRQLEEYFSGERRCFELPLLMPGTELQQSVWGALLDVRYGTTLTYGELAMKIGRRTAVRAVANAVGANALSVIVPCHRIIGADGSLTGYAGGIEAKRMLLDLEARNGAGAICGKATRCKEV